MSEPKLLQITKTIQNRLEAINGNGSFYHNLTKIERTKRQFAEEELPAGIVLLGGRQVSPDLEAGRSKLSASVSIELYALIGSRESEDVAIELLADIQRAVELEDTYLSGLLRMPLTFESDSILYPEESGETVGVRVDYVINHVRHYGEEQGIEFNF